MKNRFMRIERHYWVFSLVIFLAGCGGSVNTRTVTVTEKHFEPVYQPIVTSKTTVQGPSALHDAKVVTPLPSKFQGTAILPEPAK